MNIKKKLVFIKNDVVKHRALYTATITTAVWIAVVVKINEQHNDFLKKHDLYEEFYATDEV